ncbi:hypothetical protein AAZX31_10G160200 [Glycine max]|nr:hypothetical protein GLYMA_10G169702v4 [Glycine max]KAH1138688.1 hypothetical protein GYH30_028255 [Glycine max]
MVPKQIFLLSLFKKGALKRLFVVKRLILQYFVNVGNGMMMLSFQLDKVVALDFASRCQGWERVNFHQDTYPISYKMHVSYLCMIEHSLGKMELHSGSVHWNSRR